MAYHRQCMCTMILVYLQSPIGAVPAGATSQYVYTPVIHPGEMMYQPAQYQPTDLTDASMIEAAAPPAEVRRFVMTVLF